MTMALTSEPAVDAVESDLHAEHLRLRYEQFVVSEDLTVAIPKNSLTVIIGPNGSGKSTLLRALARLLRPAKGAVYLDGQVISSYHTKEVARRLALLPQSSIAPDGITVADLVARGRYPHQGFLKQWSTTDERVVNEAMEQTGVLPLAERYVDELSGGQRQAVWLAMVLAQQTPLVLLDEPTTYLDIAHQVSVLDLCADLHESGQHTMVVTLHDLNLAARYATHLIVMRKGEVVATGAPTEIITAELIEQTYDLACNVIPDPLTKTPMVVPLPRKRTAD